MFCAARATRGSEYRAWTPEVGAQSQGMFSFWMREARKV